MKKLLISIFFATIFLFCDFRQDVLNGNLEKVKKAVEILEIEKEIIQDAFMGLCNDGFINKNRLAMFEYLISKKVDVNKKNIIGLSPLMMLCVNNSIPENEKVFKILIVANAKPLQNYTYSFYYEPLKSKIKKKFNLLELLFTEQFGLNGSLSIEHRFYDLDKYNIYKLNRTHYIYKYFFKNHKNLITPRILDFIKKNPQNALHLSMIIDDAALFKAMLKKGVTPNKYYISIAVNQQSKKVIALLESLDLFNYSDYQKTKKQDEKQKEIEIWRSAEMENSTEAYKNYLIKYPNGEYSAEAQNIINIRNGNKKKTGKKQKKKQRLNKIKNLFK